MKGYGPNIYSYSRKCIKCNGSFLRWVGFIMLKLVPPTIFFLIVLLCKIRATSGPLNSMMFIIQLLIGILGYQSFSLVNLSRFEIFITTVVTVCYGFWNLDFFDAVIPPLCLTENISNLNVLTLNYISAVYPLLLILFTYIVVQLPCQGLQHVGVLVQAF